MAYYLSGMDFLDKTIKGIPSGTNILVVGPPGIGKLVLARNFIYRNLKAGGGGIYISTKDDAGQLKDWFTRNALNTQPYEYRLCVIDCVSRAVGSPYPKAVSSSAEEGFPNVLRVAGATDLNGIHIGMNRFLDTFRKKMLLDEALVVVESLSSILMFSNLQTVYRFLYILTGKVRGSGYVGIYTLDEELQSPDTMATLKQFCQVVIEMHIAKGWKESGERYMKISGLAPPNLKLRYALKEDRLIEV